MPVAEPTFFHLHQDEFNDSPIARVLNTYNIINFCAPTRTWSAKFYLVHGNKAYIIETTRGIGTYHRSMLIISWKNWKNQAFPYTRFFGLPSISNDWKRQFVYDPSHCTRVLHNCSMACQIIHVIQFLCASTLHQVPWEDGIVALAFRWSTESSLLVNWRYS